jgi:hypothetical protein
MIYRMKQKPWLYRLYLCMTIFETTLGNSYH